MARFALAAALTGATARVRLSHPSQFAFLLSNDKRRGEDTENEANSDASFGPGPSVRAASHVTLRGWIVNVARNSYSSITADGGVGLRCIPRLLRNRQPTRTEHPAR